MCVGFTLLALYFVHNDHLGTPNKLTNDQQSVVWTMEQTPFGDVTIGTEGIQMPMRFPGQYADAESGLSYNYFRDYDPSLGRFIQSDPIGVLRDYSDPQFRIGISMDILEESGSAGEWLNHAYGYVGQNPLFWNDPYGLAKSGQTTNLGGGITVRIDNPHVPDQQQHAHVKTPKGKAVVNKDGTRSHKGKGKIRNLTNKAKVF
ncbi:MAG: RHS repeat-associated core domain-containing protein [bacterium]